MGRSIFKGQVKQSKGPGWREGASSKSEVSAEQALSIGKKRKEKNWINFL